jgi:hypothetical protein
MRGLPTINQIVRHAITVMNYWSLVSGLLCPYGGLSVQYCMKITLYLPDGTTQFYQAPPSDFAIHNGVLSFKPIEPGNTRIRTSLPFLIEVEDK